MPAKAKITDVARAAGVSVTTVSHTLSGRRPVGEEVRGRVLRAIRELNYRPNYFAGAMKQNRTGLVGILVDQCRNAATGILLEGMEQELGSRGYEIVLGIAGLDRAKGTRLLEKFASGMVDGVINMLPQLSSDEAELIAPSLPLVTHLRQASAPVYIDYEEGARQAFEYLRGLGHRRIGCISSRRRRMNAADPVLDGCRSFLASIGETPDPALFADGDDTIDGGRRAAAQLLEQGVTAIFAANDQMARRLPARLCAGAADSGTALRDRLRRHAAGDFGLSAAHFGPDSIRGDRPIYRRRTAAQARRRSAAAPAPRDPSATDRPQFNRHSGIKEKP